MKIISLLPWPWNIWHPANICGFSAKLATKPLPTGSPSMTMAMGIVAVTSLAKHQLCTALAVDQASVRVVHVSRVALYGCSSV